MTITQVKYNSAATAITCTINSLAASATVGRQSTAVDNTSNLYIDAAVMCLFTPNASSGLTAPSTINVYVSASFDGTNYTEDSAVIGASDAGYTIDNPTNLKLGAIINASTDGKVYQGGIPSIAALFGGIMPQKWILVVINNTGQTMAASGNSMSYTGITYTSAWGNPVAIILPKPPSLWKPPLGSIINPSHPLAQGLVGAWLMNEGGGASVYDISGNNNNGTLTFTTWGHGQFGAGLVFDGATNHVNTNTRAISGTGNFTMSARINYSITSTNYDIPIWNGVDDPSAGFGLGYRKPNSNTLYAGWGSSRGEVSGLSANNNQWYHIVATYDGSTNTFYINGVPQGTASYSASNFSAGATYFGYLAADNNYFFGGTIDNIVFYNRALSAAEVQQLYLGPFCFMAPNKKYIGLSATSTASTLTVSASSLVAFTGAPLFKGTATWTGSASLTAVGKSTHKATATWSPVASLSFVGQEKDKGTATWSASAALTFTGKSLFNGVATWPSHAAFSSAGGSLFKGTLSINAAATLAFTGKSLFKSVATWQPSATFAAAPKGTYSATWTGSASLAFTGKSLVKGNLTVASKSTLSAVGHSLSKSTAIWTPASSAAFVWSPKFKGMLSVAADASLVFVGKALFKGTAAFGAHAVFDAFSSSQQTGVLDISAHTVFGAVGRHKQLSVATWSPHAIFNAANNVSHLPPVELIGNVVKTIALSAQNIGTITLRGSVVEQQ